MSRSPDAEDGGSAEEYEKGWLATEQLVKQGRSWSGHERHCVYLHEGSTPRFADVSAVWDADATAPRSALRKADL